LIPVMRFVKCRSNLMLGRGGDLGVGPSEIRVAVGEPGAEVLVAVLPVTVSPPPSPTRSP